MKSTEVNINRFNRAYFIGIGGIGMSALARYFKSVGWQVAGYDKTSTDLTDTMTKEGIEIHFEDLGPSIPELFRNNEKTLVIYTPAIPKNMGELLHVQHNNFAVHKRAEVLGMITRKLKSLCVAGTHGKTTTSTMLAHILNESSIKCSAFLGGISSNFKSNFLSSPESEFAVLEADEFDKSFLQLNPFASIITSTDTDHLDIYGNDDVFQQGFQEYADLIDPNGFLVRHVDVKIISDRTITYGLDTQADYIGGNLSFEDGVFQFDVQTPTDTWENIILGIPGIHNAENAIACIAMVDQLGISEQEIRKALATFTGVKRRFEYQIKTEKLVFIDDYAHHPTEIRALLSSIKLIYPNRQITGIFQPHLYSRTRDFFEDFAKELSRLDEVILLPIYAAREEPISGISSEMLLKTITTNKKQVLSADEAVLHAASISEGIVLTIGAGDIDRIVEPIKNALQL